MNFSTFWGYFFFINFLILLMVSKLFWLNSNSTRFILIKLIKNHASPYSFWLESIKSISLKLMFLKSMVNRGWKKLIKLKTAILFSKFDSFFKTVIFLSNLTSDARSNKASSIVFSFFNKVVFIFLLKKKTFLNKKIKAHCCTYYLYFDFYFDL